MKTIVFICVLCIVSLSFAKERNSVEDILQVLNQKELQYNELKTNNPLFYGANDGSMTHYSTDSSRPAAIDVFYGSLGIPSVRLRKLSFVKDEVLDVTAGINSWLELGQENPSIVNRSEFWQGKAISLGYETAAIRRKNTSVSDSGLLTENDKMLMSHWGKVIKQAASLQGVVIESFENSADKWSLKTNLLNASGVNALATYMFDTYQVPLIVGNLSPLMAYYDYSTNQIYISELSLAVGKLHFGLFLLHEVVHAIVRNKNNLSEAVENYKGYYMSNRLKASQSGINIVMNSSYGYSELMSFDEILAHLVMTLVQVFTSDTELFAIDGIELAIPLQKAGNLKKLYVDPYSDNNLEGFIDSFSDKIEVRNSRYAADYANSIYVSLDEYHFRVPNKDLALKLHNILSTSFKGKKIVTLADILPKDKELVVAISSYLRSSIFDLHSGINAALSELFYMKETQAKLLAGELKPSKAFADILTRIKKIKGINEILNEIPTQFFTGLFK